MLSLPRVCCGTLSLAHAVLMIAAASGGDPVRSTAADLKPLRDALHFHAPFDGTADAKVAHGDGRILTAESLKRQTLTPGIHRGEVSIAPGAGRYGDCLRFTGRTTEVLCFPGTAMHYSREDWSGTVSLWLKLTPDEDLKPGYCDPLQITQHEWNNGAFFVDFDKDLPRDFRLGVFSDLHHWNPENVPWEQWPVEKRPMVTVHRPPFQRSAWTHVAFTFERLNSRNDQPSTATLFVNGKLQGTLQQPLKFTWEPDKVAIMLGIEYIGDMDDLMIFRRALTPDEILQLSQADSTL